MVESCTVFSASDLAFEEYAARWKKDPWERAMHPHGPEPSGVWITDKWTDGQETSCHIKLTSTWPHFGGVRYWLICPRCRQKAGKLYATLEDRNYACRVCRRLVYERQYRKGWRAVWVRFERELGDPRQTRRVDRKFYRALLTGDFSDLEMQLMFFSDRFFDRYKGSSTVLPVIRQKKRLISRTPLKCIGLASASKSSRAGI